jgi:membrane-associated protease RseP (regulator of RpoE activity)
MSRHPSVFAKSWLSRKCLGVHLPRVGQTRPCLARHRAAGTAPGRYQQSSIAAHGRLLAGVLGVLALVSGAAALAQTGVTTERSVRVVFLGGDGRVIELRGVPGEAMWEGQLEPPESRRSAGPFAVVRTGDGAEPSSWVALERQPLGRGYLGATVIDLTPGLRRHFQVPTDRGVMVSALAPGSAAAEAGLAVGDVVTGLGGTRIDDADVFRREVRGRSAGDRLDLEVYRAGDRLDLVAEIAERERPLIRLEPMLVAPRQLQLRVRRIDGGGADPVEIRVEELVDQLQRVLGGGAALAGPVQAVRGADRATIERRMREVERELAELDRRLQAAGASSR